MIDNPQAYPKAGYYTPEAYPADQDSGEEGMTLLDHYAGLAMAALLQAYYTNPEAKKALDSTSFVESEDKDKLIPATTMISEISHGQAINMLKVRKNILTKIEESNATKTDE